MAVLRNLSAVSNAKAGGRPNEIHDLQLLGRRLNRVRRVALVTIPKNYLFNLGEGLESFVTLLAFVKTHLNENLILQSRGRKRLCRKNLHRGHWRTLSPNSSQSLFFLFDPGL